nr:glucose oxidase [Cryptococcus depauperatus CBS 7855]
MLSFALVPLLPLAFSGVFANSRPLTHTHNIHHPQRRNLRRSITADASSVNGQSFDFVIAGGGVAGLTLAARLSEWKNVTVLCIEAGGDGTDVEDQIDIPGYSYLHSLSGSAYDWAYTTVPQTDSLGLTKHWPRGKGLGGSGAINGLFWGRASSAEYDAWATLNPNGNEKWNWEEMNKYIKKSENFTAPSADVQKKFGMVIDPSAHGDSGPIQTGLCEYIFDEVAKWIPTWKALGLPGKDLEGGSTHGVTITASTLNTHNQTRSDSKAGYIDPLPPRSNLVILTKQQVTSVIFNGTKDANGNMLASGVTFQAAAGAAKYSVQANKEVLLAGGTVGSPQILQLSGIGPSSLLNALNIDVKVDLPVGHNLQDHVSYTMYWSTPMGTLTWGNLSASQDLQAQQLAEYKNSHTGMWTYVNEAVGYPSLADIMESSSAASSYASHVGSAIDSTISDITSWLDLPKNVASGLKQQFAIQQQWLTGEIGQLEIVFHLLGKGGNEMGIQVALQHPFSRGTIMINTTDPFTQPNINPDYFGVGYDIDIIGYGSAFARRLAKASPLSDVMITETSPGSTITDDALANFTKQNSGTEYHPLGTCSMLPKEQGGVVDTTLTVYGTGNLRVIDTSIAPLHMSAHTMATTYGIAEKASDIIKQKHWLVQPSTVTSSGSSTATAGKATDTAVTGAGKSEHNASNSPLSSGAKIGIGIGAGVGAAAILAGLLMWLIMRKRNQRGATDKGWYDRNDAYGPVAGSSAYPMAAFASHNAYTSPSPAYGHSRNESVNTIATADLAARTPMRNSATYNYAAHGLAPSGSPYRDDVNDDGMNQGHSYAPPGGQAPSVTTSGGWKDQRYHPVNI